MSFNEIFQNSTVKRVIFQIRYPSLFYLDSKIGDIQMKLMEKFPKSSILTSKQVVFANIRSDMDKLDLDDLEKNDELQKIWQFKDEHDTTVNIQSNSLDISTTFHKTYNNEGSDYKFRELIKLVVDNFLKIIKIPKITRIGLRYIDNCPIDVKSNERLKQLYNSTFPYNRFSLKDCQDTSFKTTIKKGDAFLRYLETIKKIEDKETMIFDFDGFYLNITASDYLSKLDKLHEIVSNEFEASIKDVFINYLRTGELK